MSQHKADIDRLYHMLAYARKAVQFNHRRNRDDLDADEMLAMATIHAIELIGEAIRTVSDDYQRRYPEIPWNLISGTRNRLIHGYMDIDLDIIWTIVTQDLPPLIKSLERVIRKEEGHVDV